MVEYARTRFVYSLKSSVQVLSLIQPSRNMSHGEHSSFALARTAKAAYRTPLSVPMGIYLEARGTYQWLHNCSYNPLIRPVSRVS